MHPRLRITTLVLALGALAACARPSTQVPDTGSSPDRTGAVDDTLRLTQGTSAMAAGGLTLTFVGVVSDSRCPANVMCPWAGNAAVHIRASGAGTADTVINDNIEPRAIVVAGYTITLVGLTPYPGSGDQSAPRVSLRVVR